MEKDKVQPGSPIHANQDELPLPQSLRLLRMIEKLGLNPDTVEGLRRSIIVDDKKSPEAKPGAQGKVLPQFADEEPTGTITRPTPAPLEARTTQGAVLAERTNPNQVLPTMEGAKAATQKLDFALEAELRLRHKIEAEQNWAAFKQEAWQLFEAFPRPEMAARIVDLALLYGSVSDLEEVLGSFLKEA